MAMPIQILLLLTLGGPSIPAQDLRQEPVYYGASVTFEVGVCWFWTGDAGLTARQFEESLADRDDPNRGVMIGYRKGTPPKCINLARRSARRAGFRLVRLVVDEHAGPIGPPMPRN